MQLNPIGSNMTEVETSEARILFSYRTPVAAYIYGEGVPIAGEMYRGFVRTAKWWSVTTSRHINKWLDGGTAEEVSQGFPIPLKMGLYYKSNQKEQTCNLHQSHQT